MSNVFELNLNKLLLEIAKKTDKFFSEIIQYTLEPCQSLQLFVNRGFKSVIGYDKILKWI